MKSPPPTARKNRRRPALPPWLKKRIPVSGGTPVRDLLRDLELCTVCGSARCPNQAECYAKNRATFLILGPHCTRRCTFCAVSKEAPVPPAPDEPERVAEAVARMELNHAVITSVTRDDLPDGGAAHFAATIAAIRNRRDCTIEVLTPDFRGCERDIATVADAGPDLFNHNMETVPRLYPEVRPEADYEQSLALFRLLRRHAPALPAKSGVMVGLGETRAELDAVFADLAAAGCRILTVGQYLAPTPRHRPVARYVPPEEFESIGAAARRLGFDQVYAAPFVRSSYNAEDVFVALRNPDTGTAGGASDREGA